MCIRDSLQAGGTFNESELGALQAGLKAAQTNASLAGGALVPSLTGQRDAQDWVNVFRRALERIGPGIGNGFGPQTPNVVRLDLNVGGKNFAVQGDQTTVDGLLSEIERAKRAAGVV